MAKRSYPTPRPGAAAGSSYPTSKVRGSGWEDIPHIRGHGQQLRGATSHLRSRGRPREATPCPSSGTADERSYPASEARGGGWEELPQVQEAVAAQAQEGREELLYIQGQEGWR